MPPSFISVANRGEWSISKVLDAYFKWAEGGDCFLGRCLAMLDPNDETFATLPPHWKTGITGNNEHVKRAMHMCYGVILDNHAEEEHDPTSMLTLCLASLVYHSDFLIQIESEHPGHPFSSIPILQADDLLSKLKDLVTLKPSDDVPFATGIPPHIYQAKAINKVLALCEGTQNEIRNLTTTITTAINDAIEKKALDTGNLTRSAVEDLFEGVEKRLMSKIEEMQNAMPSSSMQANTTITIDQPSNAVFNFFAPFVVPKSFEFPRDCTLFHAWRFWLKGSVFRRSYNGKIEQYQLLPYR